MQTNTQPISPVEQDSDRIRVHSIFPTIQGEGPFVGSHAIFIRLNGCNLKCAFCDTEYSTPGLEFQINETRDAADLSNLIIEVQKRTPIRNEFTVSRKQLVVITGGEPFRQNLAPMVHELVMAGYMVQIETNGTLFQNLHPAAVVVCSPKSPRINPELAQRVHSFKYVLDADHIDGTDGLPTGSLGSYGRVARPPENWTGDIYLQPMDSGDAAANERNLQAVVQSCLRHGYRLCIQTHKIANVA